MLNLNLKEQDENSADISKLKMKLRIFLEDAAWRWYINKKVEDLLDLMCSNDVFLHI